MLYFILIVILVYVVYKMWLVPLDDRVSKLEDNYLRDHLNGYDGDSDEEE